jgi:hypothetical protein
MLKFLNRSLLPLVLAVFLPAMAMAQISVEISANVPPPELPVYDQPQIPADGYLWTPGYWAWSDDYQDYYWVPGTWVLAPQPDYLWTPGYWGMQGAVFFWHPGYWGPQVGFYGGVNYGYGYGGNGYEGGYWQRGRLYYNRNVNNVGNVNITNVYNKTVINNITINRVSYNGGNGVHAQPTAAQLAASRGPHIEATPAQRQHMAMASNQPALRAGQNQGHPPIAATARPGAFSGAGVVRAKQPGTMSVVHQNTVTCPRDRPRPLRWRRASRHRALKPRRVSRNRTSNHGAYPRNRGAYPSKGNRDRTYRNPRVPARLRFMQPRRGPPNMHRSMNPMIIDHDTKAQRFTTDVDGHRAVLDYGRIDRCGTSS